MTDGMKALLGIISVIALISFWMFRIDVVPSSNTESHIKGHIGNHAIVLDRWKGIVSTCYAFYGSNNCKQVYPEIQ